MELNTFIINNFISDLEGSNQDKLDQLKKHLKESNVSYKDYEDIGLLLLFNDFNKTDKSEFEKECRSIILNRDTLEIVSYSCSDPVCNSDAKHYLLNKDPSNLTQTICQCYEGSLMHLFNHNDVWYLSTRRCLDSCDSKWKAEKSHEQMFQESLSKLGVEEITSKLSKDHCYYFVLVHHENINVVDYTTEFGDNYAKLILAIVRNKSDQTEVDIYNDTELNNIFPSELIGDDKIIRPKVFSDMTSLETENNKGFIQIPPINEGLLIKVYDQEEKKGMILKFQTADYLFGQSVGPNRNIHKGFLKLYQKNVLSNYLSNNKNFESYKKIINPTNTSESFDTIGTVDAVFKVVTSESYELFKVLWDIKTGQHRNKELYNYLPKEHKDMMFAVRGIYFQKKAEYITKKKNSTNGAKVERSVLKISDIYELLKSYDINKLEAFLKSRRLMINLVNHEKSNSVIQKYKQISNRCDKVLIKLAAIYTSKLFPEITSDDVYEGWKTNDSNSSENSEENTVEVKDGAAHGRRRCVRSRA